MGPINRLRSGDESEHGRTLGRRITVTVVLLLVASVCVGFAAADAVDSSVAQQSNDETYAVEQGDDCYEITPISGNESVKEFYDYRTPYPDNPSTNSTGQSYSSEGTHELQRPNASALFLYEDQTGNLSLVFLHGADENASQGGSVSFAIAGLPDDGTWAVKDDEYDNGHNYDNWTHGSNVDRIDWTWDAGKTDGGAYAGLGDEFDVTIDPAFNEEAALDGEYYNGTVTSWSVLSNGRESPDRIALQNQAVSITSGGCDDASGNANGGAN